MHSSLGSTEIFFLQHFDYDAHNPSKIPSFLVWINGLHFSIVQHSRSFAKFQQTNFLLTNPYLLSRHPSVSRDYGNAHCMEDLEQRLVWLRWTIQEWHSTLKTNTICPLSSSLIWLVWALPLCLGLLDKGLFKLGEAVMQCLPPGWTLRCWGFPSVEVYS